MQKLLGVTLAALVSVSTACIPYSVGTTARPAPVGRASNSFTAFGMPAFDLGDGTKLERSVMSFDGETRFGVDDKSDVGVRVSSASGIVVNYKRMLTDNDNVVDVAIMPGAGFVNMGDHFIGEFTVIASRQPTWHGQARAVVPYGGIKVMQVAPLHADAVKDNPTIGAFLGSKFGTSDLGVSPEIGVFYDHSALGVRRGDLVVVPSVTVHGDRVINMVAMALHIIPRVAARRLNDPTRPGLTPADRPMPGYTPPAVPGLTPQPQVARPKPMGCSVLSVASCRRGAHR